MRPKALLLCALAGSLGLSACSSTGTTSTKSLLIAVNAPFSVSPSIGKTIYQGTLLAVQQINVQGGVDIGGTKYRLRVEQLDDALSPQKALDNVRQAISDHAVAIVDEGTGVDATWRVANQAHVPICIVYEGGEGLVNAATRPNVFRIAPTDHGVAFRLAEYMVPKGYRIAFLHDDTTYGQEGAIAFNDAFGHTPKAVVANIGVSFSAQDLSPQVLQARRAGATALLVWGQGPTIANVLRAGRSSGWNVPVYAPPSGSDPIIRQSLSDHPDWVDGLTFASGRMTAEVGPGPFLRFEHAYEKEFGPDMVGVKTAQGRPVIQPPEFAMYPYDFVHVLAAAMTHAGAASASDRLVHALEEVDTPGANGDERGFNEKNHEGVVDDDIFFASFHDMVWAPVEDDALSATLPALPQTR